MLRQYDDDPMAERDEEFTRIALDSDEFNTYLRLLATRTGDPCVAIPVATILWAALAGIEGDEAYRDELLAKASGEISRYLDKHHRDAGLSWLEGDPEYDVSSPFYFFSDRTNEEMAELKGEREAVAPPLESIRGDAHDA